MNSAVASERQKNALFVAASFIAAIRTARIDIGQTSWQLHDSISGSVQLARMLQKEIHQDRKFVQPAGK